MRRLWLLGACGVAALAFGAACGDDSGVGQEQICDDGVDNDGDGLTDCYDDDCIGSPTCDATSEIRCDDQQDNDRDGLVDCDDPDCASDAACVESACEDLQDNDGDGLVDCADPDCDLDPACAPSTETLCADGVDNDLDGDMDCDDPDCALDPACVPDTETDCADGVDNDLDGDEDCDDSDCDGDPACAPTTEVSCSNNLDDDLDGLVDCADSDCATSPGCDGTGDTCAAILGCVQGCADLGCITACGNAGCPSAQTSWNQLFNCTMSSCFTECSGGTGNAACVACMNQNCSADVASCAANTCLSYGETNCTDGADDDLDGDTDCADSDCASEPFCGGTGDTCGEALTCAQLCGTDVACVSDCRAAACQTGQSVYGTVLTCMTTYCVDECVLNPGGGNCQQCLALHCSAEVATCLADTCQVGGETACGDGVDNDTDGDTDCADTDCQATPTCDASSEIDCGDAIDNDHDGDVDCDDTDCATHPDCSGSGWTCAEILVCSNSCGTDAGCLGGCLDGGCQSAQTAAGEVRSCLVGSCLVECGTDPQSATCQTCLATNCQGVLTACAANACP